MLRSSFVLLALALLCTGCGSNEPASNDSAVEAAGSVKGIDRSHAGQPIPDLAVRNAEGEESALSAEAGEPLLVNLWATWCAPCVKEMPTLQALSRRAGSPRVVAVSQDMGERAAVDRFLENNELGALEVWHDPHMALSDALGAQVLPTTIFYDANGREVWRYVGDLDWNGTEAARLLGATR